VGWIGWREFQKAACRAERKKEVSPRLEKNGWIAIIAVVAAAAAAAAVVAAWKRGLARALLRHDQLREMKMKRLFGAFFIHFFFLHALNVAVGSRCAVLR
jgi:hypothetical protein